MGSLALTVLTLTLGMFFIFVGQFKITPQFFPDVHEDMRREFGRVNKVFPLYEMTGWRPFAKNYRMAVGITEVVCGAILVLIPGRLKQLANLILLVIMMGAVYTHYVLHDKFDRMAPGLVFGLLLLTRLIIYRQVAQREQRSSVEKKAPKSYTEEEEEEEEEEVEQESEDQESQNNKVDKPKASRDKKKEKKNK
ncbi:unnamed protein product [Rotaria socialis]|uniref:Novel acetylcholine receptor chaperone n=1 Tax=Rotaria socialis TaxID=392032 RepID=A0A817TVF0_9BILA|nr:unnamed protein product [Rotaria socialis]CAF3335232.1 unnamed protein product [Rotaria socialis]CAF3403561.1 unnamed protein product [Rotaria socialis]CAF3545758.1 unnamed protein product [Rotaria socialis]CAF4151648.1 unnamed protein product [Rotaria socialis]